MKTGKRNIKRVLGNIAWKLDTHASMWVKQDRIEKDNGIRSMKSHIVEQRGIVRVDEEPKNAVKRARKRKVAVTQTRMEGSVPEEPEHHVQHRTGETDGT